MDLVYWIIAAVVVIIVLAVIWIYNSLIQLRVRVNNSLSQIDVQLKRRFDLIPNLVEAVKGYAKHERRVFNEVTKARASMAQAKGMREKAGASDFLSKALKSLFAVAENYPALRASENFKHLQDELSGLEEKIAYARQFYNDSVMIYNTQILVFPNNVLADVLGFKKRDFFMTAAEEKKAVKVEFE